MLMTDECRAVTIATILSPPTERAEASAFPQQQEKKTSVLPFPQRRDRAGGQSADGGSATASRAAGRLRNSLALSGTSGVAAPAAGVGQLKQFGGPEPARQPTLQSLSRNGGSEPGEPAPKPWLGGVFVEHGCHSLTLIVSFVTQNAGLRSLLTDPARARLFLHCYRLIACSDHHSSILENL